MMFGMIFGMIIGAFWGFLGVWLGDSATSAVGTAIMLIAVRTEA